MAAIPYTSTYDCTQTDTFFISYGSTCTISNFNAEVSNWINKFLPSKIKSAQDFIDAQKRRTQHIFAQVSTLYVVPILRRSVKLTFRYPLKVPRKTDHRNKRRMYVQKLRLV